MSQQPPYDPVYPPYAQNNAQPAAQPLYTAPQTPYPYAQPSSPRRFFSGRNLLLMGTILALVLGFLLYRQLTAGPAFSWVATNSTSTANVAYYLHWNDQNNTLNGTLEVVEAYKTYANARIFSVQFTGAYNSQDQTISLNFYSSTSNGQTISMPANTIETGKINGNILTLYDSAHLGLNVIYFHAGSQDEYNQAKQLVYQTHASALIMLTAQAKATEQAYTDVTATAQAQVQATVSATNQIYTQTLNSTPIFDDPLGQNTNNSWFTYAQTKSMQQVPCSFKNNALDVLSGEECYNNHSVSGYFLLQMHISIIKAGKARIDLIPQGNDLPSLVYGVEVSVNGDYAFQSTDLHKPASSSVTNLFQGNSAAIAQGLGQNQDVEVAMLYQNNTMFLYFNNKYVDSVSNTTMSARGSIGLEAPSEALFHNLKIWSLQ